MTAVSDVTAIKGPEILVTCRRCGWVHFAVSRKFAESEVKNFNDWFAKQDSETRAAYGNRPSSISGYDRCNYCGTTNLKNFRPSQPGDCPSGCTLGPIIQDEMEEFSG